MSSNQHLAALVGRILLAAFGPGRLAIDRDGS